MIRRIWNWFVVGQVGWLTIVLLVVVAAILLSEDSLSLSKERDSRLIGLLLQVLGFVILWRELHDINSQFKRPQFGTQLLKYWRSFPVLRQPRRIVSANVTEGRGDSFSMTLHGEGLVGDLTVEQRVELLEMRVKSVEAQQVQQGKDHREFRARTEKTFGELKEEVRKLDAHTQATLEEAIAGGVHLEVYTILYFVLGSVLATLSPEIAKWTVLLRTILSPSGG